MYRKIYGIIGAVLILIDIVILNMWAEPVLSSEGMFGLGSIILALMIIGSGFIEKKILRLSLATSMIILWVVILYIGFIVNPIAIF